MDSPVRSHILALEHEIQELNDSLTSSGSTAAARERIMVKIEVAKRALTYYQKALELEDLIHQTNSNLRELRIAARTV